jgi:hypothetical protein
MPPIPIPVPTHNPSVGVDEGEFDAQRVEHGGRDLSIEFTDHQVISFARLLEIDGSLSRAFAA